MPSQVNPRTGPFPVYLGASPPTSDVGIFAIVKTGVDLKTAGTTDIFTVPAGRRFVATLLFVEVTAVTSGGAGTLTSAKIVESSAGRSMIPAQTSASGTPVANQTVYNSAINNAGSFMSNCIAGNKVQLTIAASNAGSTAVTGSVFVIGFYST